MSKPLLRPTHVGSWVLGAAVSALLLSGCTETRGVASLPVEPAQSAAAQHQLVILRPVLKQGEQVTPKTAYKPVVVHLRPVMQGEQIDLPRND